ncbi:MAG: hypothetical protein JRE40_03330 [Deltaproteobacteria bacterium]|nr:hypothetical protein [Deltaproteobacteria bacterium]MBW2672976.1 hypothetical protein [Deltaproteobacteria bacterium]
MKDVYKVMIFLIACVTVLESIALFKNIDGQIFATVLAGMIGFAAYLFPSPIKSHE